MFGLATIQRRNAEAAIKASIVRSRERGLVVNREAVLEDIRFTDDEDVSVWAATVDKLIKVYP